MSLDPRIALEAGANVPQLDPAGSMLKGANAQAQIIQNQYAPQVIQQKLDTGALANEATSMTNQQQARELATKKRLAAIAAANSTLDKSTGKITVDHSAIASQAASEGMDAGTVFKYLAAGQERQAEGLKQGGDQVDIVNKVLDPVTNLLRVQTDPQEALKIAGGAHKLAVDTLVKGGMDPQAAEAQVTKQAQSKLGLSGSPPLDANGQPDPVAAGMHLIQQAKLAGASTISPQQGEVNAQNNANNYTDPDFRAGVYGTNSKVTGFGKSLITQGLATEEDLQGLTGKQIYDRYGEAAKSNQASGTQRIEAGKTVASVNSKLSTINDALSIEGDLRDNTGFTKLGTLTSKKWNDWITQNPKLGGQVQGAIDQYNIDHPGANMSVSDGLPTVFARLRQEQAAIKNLGTQASAVAAGAGGIAKATKAGAEPQPPANPPKAAPQLSPADLADHRKRAMAALQKGAPVSAVKKVFKEQTGQDL